MSGLGVAITLSLYLLTVKNVTGGCYYQNNQFGTTCSDENYHCIAQKSKVGYPDPTNNFDFSAINRAIHLSKIYEFCF